MGLRRLLLLCRAEISSWEHKPKRMKKDSQDIRSLNITTVSSLETTPMAYLDSKNRVKKIVQEHHPRSEIPQSVRLNKNRTCRITRTVTKCLRDRGLSKQHTHLGLSISLQCGLRLKQHVKGLVLVHSTQCCSVSSQISLNMQKNKCCETSCSETGTTPPMINTQEGINIRFHIKRGEENF